MTPFNYRKEYEKYFKKVETEKELYDLDVVRNQLKSKNIDYSDINLEKWLDTTKSSPTTPKTSTSKLPSTETVMLPFSEE